MDTDSCKTMTSLCVSSNFVDQVWTGACLFASFDTYHGNQSVNPVVIFCLEGRKKGRPRVSPTRGLSSYLHSSSHLIPFPHEINKQEDDDEHTLQISQKRGVVHEQG